MIKKILLVVIVLSFGNLFSQVPQNTGIYFLKDKKWEEILKLAKSSNKPIMVSASAVWCGPCKSMKKNVLNQKEVGDFYNMNFINYEIDVDSANGKKIMQMFFPDEQIGDIPLPNYFFVDLNGLKFYAIEGRKDLSEFILEGKAAAELFNKKIRSK